MAKKRSDETNIAGDAHVEGGDFVAHDKIVQYILDGEKIRSVLQQNLPANDPTPKVLLDTLNSFRYYHACLFEWKEVHNFLNGVLITFGQFTGEVDRTVIKNLSPNVGMLTRLCHPLCQKVNVFAEWAKTIQHIDTPFTISELGIQGPSWVVDVYLAKERLEQLLKLSNVEIGELNEARSDFGGKAEIHMYLADMKLRETADELCSLSMVVLGSLGHE